MCTGVRALFQYAKLKFKGSGTICAGFSATPHHFFEAMIVTSQPFRQIQNHLFLS